MGQQPDQGQFAQGPGTPDPTPPRRSRTGMWIALGCAVLLILLLLIAVTGGVIYLVGRGGGSESSSPEMAQYSGEHFGLQYPADWVEDEITEEDKETGMVLDLRDEQVDADEIATNSLAVYVFDSDLHAKAECDSQATWIGFTWDEVEDPTEIDPLTLDGKELPAYRALGTHDDREAISEMYCADVGNQVMQIMVESHGATEVSPEITAMLDSWIWTDPA